MSNRKSFKVTEKEYMFLQRMKTLSAEDKQRLRLKNIESNKRIIKQRSREINFKKEQIKKKELLEKHDGYLDGKKPFWCLENEIDELEIQIEGLEEQIKGAKEEYDKENAM